MKTILLTLLTITMSTSLFANMSFSNSTSQKDERLCKIFHDKAINYKKTMRNDIYAEKTLENYENKTKLFCSE